MEAPLFNWLNSRSAGLLLHPTSFPGSQGVGVLDPLVVDSFFEYMKSAGLSNWQICPLGPTGFGDSPYQCFSAFAGNPYLIDLNPLVETELLRPEDLEALAALPSDQVDFGGLYYLKWPILMKAYDAFVDSGSSFEEYGNFDDFCEAHSSWLTPYGLFQALKAHFGGKPWWLWPEDLRFFSRASKSPLADDRAVQRLGRAHAFFQYLFFGQWNQVRAKAKQAGLTIIGDAPIFVAADSADVWSHPHLFQIDQTSGKSLKVAGVPPDYFSADGQLWGNPLYAWDAHQQDGYSWWIERLRANLNLCDIVRIDHFRGFDTYWSIPAKALTAKTGLWEKGPGLDFFKAMKNALPECRLIAEDLGELVPSVVELREACGLPGMTILQFAFGSDASNLYLPHNVTANSVIYPGTHDNDTTLGWYSLADSKTTDHVRRYLRVDGQEIGWDFVRAAYTSVSNMAIIPIQDLMSLGSGARFNTPGLPQGNWQWRFSSAEMKTLHTESSRYLRDLAELTGRN